MSNNQEVSQLAVGQTIIQGASTLVALGICLSPYGLKGDLKIRSYSGETEHFARLLGKILDLRKEGKLLKLQVSHAGEYGQYGILRFQGHESPESAHSLSGYEIWAPRELGVQLATGEYYISDLTGCILEFDGREMARVRTVWESTACMMLDVEMPDGSRKQVPFQNHFIGVVDVVNKKLELLKDWILDT
jgi:16S rRNA processing protein RimM